MLKVAIDVEEKFGGLLMTWWDGQGAAQVFAHEDGALLMERAEGTNSLVEMVLSGGTMKPAGSFAAPWRSSTRRDQRMEGVRFRILFRLDNGSGIGARGGGTWTESPICAATARELLASEQEGWWCCMATSTTAIFSTSVSRWLAIDPKGLIGKRRFD